MALIDKLDGIIDDIKNGKDGKDIDGNEIDLTTEDWSDWEWATGLVIRKKQN